MRAEFPSEFSTGYPRKPWLAALLAFLFGPLGFLYSGLLLFSAGLIISAGLAFIFFDSIQGIYGDFIIQVGLSTLCAVIAYYYALFTPHIKQFSRTGRFDRPVWWKVLLYLVLSLGTLFLFTQSIVTVTSLSSYSMVPTIQNNARVFTLIAQPLRGGIQRGLIARYRASYPGDPRQVSLISRVVAVEGDTVEMKHGLLYVNGKGADDPTVISILKTAGCINTEGSESNRAVVGMNDRPDVARLKIPAGYVYMLADNRAGNFEDSRFLGPISLTDITGVVRAPTKLFMPKTRADCLPTLDPLGLP